VRRSSVSEWDGWQSKVARKAGCMNTSDDRTQGDEEASISGAGSHGSSLSTAASSVVVGVRQGSRSEGVGSVDKLLRPFGVPRGASRTYDGSRPGVSVDTRLVPISGGYAQLRRRLLMSLHRG
jgi:hypothetical protein